MPKDDSYAQLKTSKGILCPMMTAGSIGLHLVSGMLVGVLFGYTIDCYFIVYPWCSGIGLLFGIIAGFRLIWKDAKKIMYRDEHE